MKPKRGKMYFLKQKYLNSVIFFILLIIGWHLSTLLFSIPDYILPSPLQVGEVFRDYQSLLIGHTLVTLQEIIIGFLIGAAAGFVLAVAIITFDFLYRTLYPFIIVVESVPKLALAPLFVIWFGFGMLPKIVIIILMVLFPVLVNMIKGLTSVQRELLDLMKSLRASKLQILTKISIPYSIPYFFASLKMSSALAVVGAIIGEFVGANKGLGYVLMMSSVDLSTSRMFAVLIVLGLIGLAIFAAVCILERIVLPWHLDENNSR